MIKYYKKSGETPLEMLERMRCENSELASEKLSYAGRLDPLAEGEMLVLVGEENKRYKEFLNYDKEYEATFLTNISTDTYDILGKITRTGGEVKDIEEEVSKLLHIKSQTYPWFSSKTINGKKLFDHFKEGNTEIERPKREVSVKEVQYIGTENISKEILKEYIYKTINKVNGDFRQDEILKLWEEYFENSPDEFLVFKIRVLVSTGTYIRSFTENFSFPSTLLKLKRTKIVI